LEQSRTILLAAIGCCLIILVLTLSLWDEHYLLASFLFVAAAILPFFLRFERKQVNTREIVLVAILASIAAVSRIPFAPLPNVQPTTFVIIVTALVFGAETGFMVGATAALVSNLFLGQGPWTPWQMFSWGMVGFSAGLLKDSWWMSKRWGQWVFGFVWGFVFGWIMNITYIFGFVGELSWQSFIAACASSAFFDLAHALSNVFFLAVFGASWMKILRRFKRKYGLLGDEALKNSSPQFHFPSS
jgi:energy-coupling factor transport system substrate-specific component